ncbi:MAG: mechanosensitive ion channel family protein [Ignavibacterium sp.]
MDNFLNIEFAGNTIRAYFISLIIFLVGLFVIFIIRKIVLNRLEKWAKKTKSEFDDFLISKIEKQIIPIFYFLAFYLGLESLHFSKEAHKIIDALYIIVITFFVVRFAAVLVNFAIYSYWKRREGEDAAKNLRGISSLINLLVYSIGLIFLLENLGLKISTVVAGLGIGGIAVALAAQKILGDLFNYFVIFFDRPFQVGDFIMIDNKLGSIEKIGLKSTRIKSLSGEQLVFSNTDLTNARIHNFKQMERRRVAFTIGVIYQSKLEQLQIIPQLIKNIIESHDDVQFDRSHFSNYGNFSLNFETVYFVNTSDYNKYMDIQQSINLNIYKEFSKQGIEFAYPTQTIFLEQNTN